MSPVRKIDVADLDETYKTPTAAPSKQTPIADAPLLPVPTKKESEDALIKRALEAAGGNKSKAAEILGISRRTLYRKLAENG